MNYLCPFHNDKNASLLIKKKFFVCFGCKFKGKTFINNFIKIKNFDNCFSKKLIFFAQLFLCYKKNFWLTYLLKRKINANLIIKYNLGMISIKIKKKNKIINLKNRLIFPIIKNNILIGIGLKTKLCKPKYVNFIKSNISKKNLTYGICNISNSIIIVEGYFDLLTLNNYKVYNVISTFGCAISEEKILSLIKNYKFIYFCFDGDHAGYIAKQKILILIKKQKLKKIICKILPTGYDPDEFIKIFGINLFLKFLKNEKN